MIPDWLHILLIVSLIAGFLCAGIVAIEEARDPQHMWIMNIVWPMTVLFGSVLIVWAKFRYGELAAHSGVKPAMEMGEEMPNKRFTPFAVMVAKGSLHCGSGCTLGDICAEWLAFAFPAIAVWLGWQSLFPDKFFAVWVLDVILAFLFGVTFQYFTIKPTRGLSRGQGLNQAMKADALSLTAWQLGMYGFMALANFRNFAHLLCTKFAVTAPNSGS